MKLSEITHCQWCKADISRTYANRTSDRRWRKICPVCHFETKSRFSPIGPSPSEVTKDVKTRGVPQHKYGNRE